MGGKSSRVKGHSFERQVARWLRAVYPDARRGLQYQDGSGAPDVIIPGFHIECKRGKRTNIKAALRQATGDSEDGRISVAICKDDNELATATMYFEDWIELLENAKEGLAETGIGDTDGKD